MHLTQVFRTFLVSDVLVRVASVLAGVQAADATEEPSSESLLYLLVGITVLVAWVTALAGLWRLRNWARTVYLALAGVGLVAHLLLGGEAGSGLEDSLNALSWLVIGAIIVLTYWSPLASIFRADERAA
jgi:hypothetical protein